MNTELQQREKKSNNKIKKNRSEQFFKLAVDLAKQNNKTKIIDVDDSYLDSKNPKNGLC